VACAMLSCIKIFLNENIILLNLQFRLWALLDLIIYFLFNNMIIKIDIHKIKHQNIRIFTWDYGNLKKINWNKL
jgi:hypothetical protein